jgi:hypothetical protein
MTEFTLTHNQYGKSEANQLRRRRRRRRGIGKVGHITKLYRLIPIASVGRLMKE